MLERAAPSRREALAIAVAAISLAGICGARVWAWRASAPPLGVERGPAPGLVLDVNRADWPELESLPGIGETSARRIVADRAARGPFRSVDDLARVEGLTRTQVERLRPHVTVGAFPVPASAAAGSRSE